MRVVCPGCAAVYELPEAVARPGRAARCDHCGHRWELPAVLPSAPETVPPPDITVATPDLTVATADAHEPAGPVPFAPEPAAPARRIELAHGPAMLRPDRPAKRQGSAGPVVLGWLATCLVLASLVWGAYAYRREIMVAWPPSTRAYAGLGLVK